MGKGARADMAQILETALRGLCKVRAPRDFEQTAPPSRF